MTCPLGIRVLSRLEQITRGLHLVDSHSTKNMDEFVDGKNICVMIKRGDTVYAFWPRKRTAPALTHLFDAYGT
jgi:hypothetical protein